MLILIALTGCEDQSSIGIEVLPAGDLISVRNTIQNTFSFTHSEDSIRTDESAHSMLGSFNDSLFGNTTIGFASQFRLYDFPDFGKNPKADSIKLYLYYRIIYGDTLRKQKFNVYELDSPLDIDSKYTQDIDLKSMTTGDIIGEYYYKPKVKIDSTTKDTFYQLINIPIDISLAEKLINADTTEMVNNDVFLEFFIGLYIETEKQTGKGGAILSLETVQQGSFNGSALVLFYSNDSILTHDFSSNTVTVSHAAANMLVVRAVPTTLAAGVSGNLDMEISPRTIHLQMSSSPHRATEKSALRS